MTSLNVTEQESNWVIESKYTTVQFKVQSFFIFTVVGSFADVQGAVKRDDTDIRRSTVDVRIRVDSLNTGNRKRDAHLLSSDFLDAGRYPEIHFQSRVVERGKDRDTLRVTGLLTVKEQSREVVIEVTEVDESRSPHGEEVAYYTAQTSIGRSDFGITRSRALIGETLKITAYVQALKV